MAERTRSQIGGQEGRKAGGQAVLLHSCCAICSGYPIAMLREAGFEPVVYFYNPNILPREEYERRLEAQKTLCKHLAAELIEGEYEPKKFQSVVKGLENEPEGKEYPDE